MLADIAAFEDFLTHAKRGHEFEFSAFGLEVRGVEHLAIEYINTEPAALDDAAATDEDTVLVVAGPGVLANDSDPDHLDVIQAQPVGS